MSQRLTRTKFMDGSECDCGYSRIGWTGGHCCPDCGAHSPRYNAAFASIKVVWAEGPRTVWWNPLTWIGGKWVRPKEESDG